MRVYCDKLNIKPFFNPANIDHLNAESVNIDGRNVDPADHYGFAINPFGLERRSGERSSIERCDTVQFIIERYGSGQRGGE
ncbi:hypothetical protein Aca07nite_25890 [Actinoplanes capillaceus]|uniref:HNH endonuclease n=1 Tax=Actinoplanes campanulatus TaxID=113559 RepID=A0ABQ3WE67_9ACTN|nr:hypothetical protein [Actinoplanes capillaceus]GID45314.1 hypothetical protein Aca07nite_25890 [Actinoplanes capillaceus]